MIFKNGRPTPNDGLGIFHAAQSEPWQVRAASFARALMRAQQMNVRAASDACKNAAATRAGALTPTVRLSVGAATRKQQTPVSGMTQHARGCRRIHVRRLSDD